MVTPRATPEATERYAKRFPAEFFRTAAGLTVSSVGIGTYLGGMDEASDARYVQAITAALRGGINFVDTSLNYRHQRSERCIARALLRSGVDREAVVVCTKAGYLVPGAVPDGLGEYDVAGGMHSMAPRFLADQLERSRENLALDCIDVFYLHNPETQLQHVGEDDFYARIHPAFEALEAFVERGMIQYYGVATWQGLRAETGGMSLARLEDIAVEVAGPAHHFAFVQLPFNLAMPEAFTIRRERVDGEHTSVLSAAHRLGINVVASASILQSRLASGLPDALAILLGPGTDAQRAIQFTRSTPGVTVALVGMGNPDHVRENLEIAAMPRLTADQYLSVFQRSA